MRKPRRSAAKVVTILALGLAGFALAGIGAGVGWRQNDGHNGNHRHYRYIDVLNQDKSTGHAYYILASSGSQPS
jgi:hypothetical protein